MRRINEIALPFEFPVLIWTQGFLRVSDDPTTDAENLGGDVLKRLLKNKKPAFSLGEMRVFVRLWTS